MFIAALFSIANIWKQPSTNGWIKKMWHIQIHTQIYILTYTYKHTYTMDYYSTIKMNKTLPFATIQMDLGNIMLSEISQTEKDKYCMLSLICGIWKINQWIQQKGNRLRDTENKLVVTSEESKERRGKRGMGVKEVHTMLWREMKQNREYSQHFIIVANAVYPLKTVNHYAVHL